MKKKICHVLAVICLCSIGVAADDRKEKEDRMMINIDNSMTYQTIRHFGASAAWWAQDVGAWPSNIRDKILDLLFDHQKGIGLNIVRYNIGGGKAQANITDPWRSVESPLNQDGRLDWSKDKAAMSVIDGAVSRGASVILFSNSPPAAFTRTGSPTGNGFICNLRPDARDAFSAFLADCVIDLGKRWPLVAISPINEPQWDWQPKKGQEGCYYSPDDAVQMVESLVKVFLERHIALPISVVDSGEWSIVKNRPYIDALLASPVIRSAVTHYAVHSYWSDSEDRVDLSTYLDKKAPELPIWQTEWTEMRGQQDEGMQGALALAITVHEDLVVGNVSSWQYWIAVSKYDYADGLVYVDPADHSFKPTKRLWALGNWSRFVLPGAVRLDCTVSSEARLLVSAFRNPDGTIVTVVVNGYDGDSPIVDLSLPAGGTLKRWETSAFADLDERQLAKGRSLSFPAQSITTLEWNAH